jgi:hypothetical protein
VSTDPIAPEPVSIPAKDGMGIWEGAFWISLTIFGTGLYLVSDQLIWGAILTIVGAAGILYTLRKFPAYSLKGWIVVAAFLGAAMTFGYDIYARMNVIKDLQRQIDTLTDDTRTQKNIDDQALQKKDYVIQIEKEAADRWRFSSRLRSISQDSGNATCVYQFIYDDPKDRWAVSLWSELLRAGAWRGAFKEAYGNSVSPGITIRSGPRSSVGFKCASELQKALSDIYPNLPAKAVYDQTTDFLAACAPQNCVQIEISY